MFAFVAGNGTAATSHASADRNLEQYEREIVSKLLPSWGKFAICHRNFRSQRREYGK
jgi:hypothetical protein